MRRILAFCLLVVCAGAWAADYYISPTGDDGGAGTSGDPWETLSYACSQATSPGDVIHAVAGSYSDSGYCWLMPGVDIVGAGIASTTFNVTAEHGYGGYIVGLGTGVDSSPARETYTANPSGHVLSDFAIDGDDSAEWAIRFRARDNVDVHNVALSNFTRTGMRIEGYANTQTASEPPWYITGVTVHDCTWDDTSYGVANPAEHFGALELESIEDGTFYNLTFGATQHEDGVAIKQGQWGWLKHCEFYNIEAHMDTSDGNSFVWEVYNLHDDCSIHDCEWYGPWSYNGGPLSLTAGSSWNVEMYNNVHDMSAWTAETFLEMSHHWVSFHDNYVIGNATMAHGYAIWTNAAGRLTDESVTHHDIYNNVFYDCRQNGVYVQVATGTQSFTDFRIYNNVIDTVTQYDGYGGWGISATGNTSDAADGWEVHNNIIMNCNQRWIYLLGAAQGWDVDNNYLYGNANSNQAYDASGSSIDTNTIAEPALNYAGDKPDPYYRPDAADANVIDAGVDEGPSDVAPTVGAYLYEETYGYFLMGGS